MLNSQDNPKKRRFSPITCFLIIILLSIVFVIGSYFIFRFWYSNGINDPNSDDSTIVELIIEPGSTSEQIGELLFQNELIMDKFLWTVYIRLNNSQFLADKYNLPKNLSIKQIAETLEKPAERKIVWITFPEGLSLKRVTEIFQNRQAEFTGESFTAADFAAITEFPDEYQFSDEIQEFLQDYKPPSKSLEGFLYPNTYSFEADYVAKEVVEIFLKEFIKQVSHLDKEGGKYSFYDSLILASIVEKESLDEEDRPVIAGIFANRVDAGMLLQADSTINYLTGKHDRRTWFEDIDAHAASPYNTYKNVGLPPTPIANPRLHSIEVSLNPIDTDYYYFLHEIDGTVHYATNLDGHYQNERKYLDNE